MVYKSQIPSHLGLISSCNTTGSGEGFFCEDSYVVDREFPDFVTTS